MTSSERSSGCAVLAQRPGVAMITSKRLPRQLARGAHDQAHRALACARAQQLFISTYARRIADAAIWSTARLGSHFIFPARAAPARDLGRESGPPGPRLRHRKHSRKPRAGGNARTLNITSEQRGAPVSSGMRISSCSAIMVIGSAETGVLPKPYTLP